MVKGPCPGSLRWLAPPLLVPEGSTDLVCGVQEPHVKAWLSTLFQALTHEETPRVGVTLRAIWHAHRKSIHENIYQSLLSTHCFIERFLADLKLIETKPVHGVVKPTPGSRWIPSPGGLMKVNMDAATS